MLKLGRLCCDVYIYATSFYGVVVNNFQDSRKNKVHAWLPILKASENLDDRLCCLHLNFSVIFSLTYETAYDAFYVRCAIQQWMLEHHGTMDYGIQTSTNDILFVSVQIWAKSSCVSELFLKEPLRQGTRFSICHYRVSHHCESKKSRMRPRLVH